MNVAEARALLGLIELFDKRPFLPAAADLWAEELREVAFVDAEAAVRKIFRLHGYDAKGSIRTLLPFDVKGVAAPIAAARIRRASQPAVTSAHRSPAERSEAAAAAVARARATVAAAEARYREKVAA